MLHCTDGGRSWEGSRLAEQSRLGGHLLRDLRLLNRDSDSFHLRRSGGDRFWWSKSQTKEAQRREGASAPPLLLPAPSSLHGQAWTCLLRSSASGEARAVSIASRTASEGAAAHSAQTHRPTLRRNQVIRNQDAPEPPPPIILTSVPRYSTKLTLLSPNLQSAVRRGGGVHQM